MAEKFVFSPAQREGIKAKITIEGQSGSGKAQPLSSLVLTDRGWRPMGDIAVGDRVANSAGGFSTVTGVFPQGEKEVFRVTFSDGASTECCDEHLWFTSSPHDRARNVDPKKRERALTRRRAAKRVKTGSPIAPDAPPTIARDTRDKMGPAGAVRPLSEIRASLRDKRGKWLHWIPMVKPVDFPARPLPLHPYVLGVLLGDGTISRRDGVQFTSKDPDLIDEVDSLIPRSCRVSCTEDPIQFGIIRQQQTGDNEVLAAIRGLGLSGTTSATKFVPSAYLYASAADRLALLQGLMDTDGYAGGHALEYTSCSQLLATHVRFLVESLGGTVAWSSRIPRCLYKGEYSEGLRSYRLYICLPPSIVPFRLPRKVAAYIPHTTYLPRRAIVAVKSVGRKACQCIAVDAPDHLYVTDHCILTHNTVAALQLAYGLCGDWSRIGVGDTEYRRALYTVDQVFDGVRVGQFKHCPVAPPYSPRRMTELLTAAERSGELDVFIFDSLSKEWEGVGGTLESVGTTEGRSQFTAWKGPGDEHRRFIDAVIASPLHVIATMRSKTKYDLVDEEKNGRVVSVPKKRGLEPIQRAGTEYEFDVAFRLDDEHTATISKDNTRLFMTDAPGPITPEHGRRIVEWSKGAALQVGGTEWVDLRMRQLEAYSGSMDGLAALWAPIGLNKTQIPADLYAALVTAKDRSKARIDQNAIIAAGTR